LERGGALAQRAGIDASSLDRPPTAAERRATLLEHAFDTAGRELRSERGDQARAYLAARGILQDQLADAGLGLFPDPDRLRASLLSAGHSRAEVDARSPPRRRALAGPRDRSLARRAVSHQHLLGPQLDDQDASSYLYLRGATRPPLPYGLADQPAEQRRELLLVEGVLDVHTLRTNGIANVAALGGASLSGGQLERLHALGIERVVLAFDNDDPGRTAAERAVDQAVRAHNAPEIWIIDPDLLDEAKDPGELLRRHGLAAFRFATATPVCGVASRALSIADRNAGSNGELTLRAGFASAAAWLGTLPPRLAIEQTRALDTVADSFGYDPAAAQRAFRARYWRREQSQGISQPRIGLMR
jgi:DNA primase